MPRRTSAAVEPAPKPDGSGCWGVTMLRGRGFARARSQALLGGDGHIPADLLGARERTLGAENQQLRRLLCVPARDARRGGLAARRRRADAIEDLDRGAEVTAGQDEREAAAAEPREQVDLAQLVAPQRGGLLDQPIALALAVQRVEHPEVIEVDHGQGDGQLVPARAGELARELLAERAP